VSDLFDIYDEASKADENPYEPLGLLRNPFRSAEPQPGKNPLYTGHIETELKLVRSWLRDVQMNDVRQPLSLVGTIGSGKTALLTAIEAGIKGWPASEKTEVFRYNLPDIGMSKPNLGALLIGSIERMAVDGVGNVPDKTLRLVWGVVRSRRPIPAGGRLTDVLERLRRASAGEQQQELVHLFSRWIERNALTPAQAHRLGLHRRIDWEGEVVPVAAELLKVARKCEVIRTVFILVDQLEDLFTSNVTPLRRARILTDLRGLIDEIDAGAPIGLLLSWSPDVHTGLQDGQVEAQLQQQYEALFSRMQRNRVDIPYLTRDDVNQFTAKWLKPAIEEVGQDPRQPKPAALAESAWNAMKDESALFPGGKTTPREFLTYLSREVDRRVGLA
jgi:hypothetical protein